MGTVSITIIPGGPQYTETELVPTQSDFTSVIVQAAPEIRAMFIKDAWGHLPGWTVGFEDAPFPLIYNGMGGLRG